MKRRVDAAQNGVRSLLRVDGHIRRRSMPVVPDPPLAEDIAPEAVVQILEVVSLGIEESVGGGAQAGQGLAGLHVVQDELELILGQLPPAEEENGKIGCAQGLESFDVVVGLRRGPRIGDRGAEAVPCFEDPGDHRHRELRAIFIVSRHEHHVGLLSRSSEYHDGQRGQCQQRFCGIHSAILYAPGGQQSSARPC